MEEKNYTVKLTQDEASILSLLLGAGASTDVRKMVKEPALTRAINAFITQIGGHPYEEPSEKAEN